MAYTHLRFLFVLPLLACVACGEYGYSVGTIAETAGTGGTSGGTTGGTTGGTACTPDTWVNFMQASLQTQCGGCHAPGAQPPDLSQQAAWKANLAIIQMDINMNRMPIPAYPAGSPAKARLLQWLGCNAP